MDRNHLINGEIVDYWGYLKSIDWYEPWLIALILVHIGTITVTVCTRNYSVFQVILFVVLLLLVYFSETINGLGATYWKSFSREQYFDSDGLFISTIFSIPILLNCMLMISNWLYSSTVLMSKVKAAQLREERKKMSIRMSMYNPEGNQSTEERQKRMSLLNSQWNSMYGPEATQLREERKSRMTMLKNRLNNPEAADPSTEPSTEPTEEPNTEPSVKLPRRKSLSKSPSKSKHKSE